jgi:hypothetical protein
MHGAARSNHLTACIWCGVTVRHEGYDPPLAEVRAAVERKWRDDKRDAFRKAEYERLRDKYEIVLPDAPGAGRTAKAAQ